MRQPKSLHLAVTHPSGHPRRQHAPRPRCAASPPPPTPVHPGRAGPLGVTAVAVTGVVTVLGGRPAPGGAALLLAAVLGARLTWSQHRTPQGSRPRVAAADRLVALLLGVLLLPVLLVICLAVRVTSSGPVLERVARAGRDGVAAPATRFRTTSGRGPAGPARAAPTAVGSVLRRLSLDELPCLLDVVTGARPFPRALHR